MPVEIIMFVGVLIGYFFSPKKSAGFNARLRDWSVPPCLYFTMGVSLGSRESFFEELAELGIESAIFSIVPIIFSVIAVFLLQQSGL